MRISEMFKAPIDRNIKGVITVGEEAEAEIHQELSEYVVTTEMNKHFHDFVSAFTNALDAPTDKMGVWISGFFGSGKSHFLKMLSYLLENRSVTDKTALQYFEDKLEDPALKADLLRIAKSPADVIIFNIDSKSLSDSKANKEAIIEVFLNVFNEMQGFSGQNPWVADLERKMSKDGTYDEFKKTYHEIAGLSWDGSDGGDEGRDTFDFDMDLIVESLVKSKAMTSADSAKSWYEKSNTQDYRISIEQFSKLIKTYCDSKSKNHRVIFLVDEVGQYIGDNTDLMLNLQTLVEDLGKFLKGRAWIAVTSQEAIDRIIDRIKGDDFSKIMGRFATRLSLSSTNTDEVIKRRLLKKTDVSSQTLQAVYGDKSSILKNQISFSANTAEMKTYSTVEEFTDTYPFIPYQFTLMQKVFEQIRRMGETGKHLSEGERSMLSSFQESVLSVGDKEVGSLVPLSSFYNSLESFLDGAVSRVITQGRQNANLNPEDIDLLKILFMIKHVKEVKPNIENLTTLSLDHFDQDKITLRKQITESLIRLTHETLVQKSGDEYYFLTDEEQDVNRGIKDTDIDEPREILDYMGKIVFDEIYGEAKFSYNKWRSFVFNKRVDDILRGKQGNELTLWIMTPYSDAYDYDNHTLASKMVGIDVALLKLPADTTYLEEIQMLKKTVIYLRRRDSQGNSETMQTILDAKRREISHSQARIQESVENAISSAKVFVHGQFRDVSESSAKARMESSLCLLTGIVFRKFNYIDQPVQHVADVEHILRSDDVEQLSLDGWETNKQALEEMERYIERQSSKNIRVSMKSLFNEFTSKPYGWGETDISALVARLIVRGTVVPRYNGQIVDRRDSALIGHVTKVKGAEKLVIERKVRPNKTTLDKVRKIMKEVSGRGDWSDKEDPLFEQVRDELRVHQERLKGLKQRYDANGDYPGKTIVEKGFKDFERLFTLSESNQLFDAVTKAEDDLLDYAEDIRAIKGFFENQVRIWDTTRKQAQFFANNSLYLSPESNTALATIENIMASPQPYAQVKELPSLVDTIDKDYQAQLQAVKAKVHDKATAETQVVTDELKAQNIAPSEHDSLLADLQELTESIDGLSDCNQVVALGSHLDNASGKALDRIQELKATDQGGSKPAPPTRKVRLDSVVKKPRVIRTEADIDALLKELKTNLKAILDEGNEIRLH